MAIEPEDHEKARSFRQELQRTTSLDGHGIKANSDFEEEFQKVLRRHNPSATVIWMAASMQKRHFDGQWSHIAVSALEDQFRVTLNGELIDTQKRLADSNDRLGRRMFWVSFVGVIVAVVGAAAAVIALILHR